VNRRSHSALDIRQRRLLLLQPGSRVSNVDVDLHQSLIELTRRLVSIPSQSGVDNQSHIIDFLGAWLEQRGVTSDVVVSRKRRPASSCLGLVSVVGSGRPPFYLLTACSDTANVGNRDSWDLDPFSGRVDEKGWLHGRGSADSKSGLAIFAHLITDEQVRATNGTVVFLADSDEHSGTFGAIKDVVRNRFANKLNGAFIGYPGIDKIGVGSRGFFRVKITFFGKSQHSGAKKPNYDDANEDCIRFCADVVRRKHEVEGLVDDSGVSPRVSITQVLGGSASYSSTSDRCVARLDFRLTRNFQRKEARDFLRSLISEGSVFGDTPSIDEYQSWPAYSLPEASPLLFSLEAAIRASGLHEPLRHISGPSNVGNYLASVGIDAVSGFGLQYEGIHAANEKVSTTHFVPVFQAYKSAVLQLTSTKAVREKQ
jgi:succinyl-diaminopimelate desuccinylase